MTRTVTLRAVCALAGAALLAPLGCSGGPGENTGRTSSSVGTRQGVDYSWGRPSPSGLAAAGYTFACRYLSYDTTGKNLSAGEARSLEAAGVDVVANWEDSGTAALGGYAQGVSDAKTADSQAAADGSPSGRPIYFSVDFDASASDQPTIDSYFDGVASVIGRSRTGAYGGYYLIQRLFDDGKITYGWQTYAWSYGNWDSRAQLRQVENGATVAGASVDIDQAVAADFGQWGYASGPSTPPAPTKVCGQAQPLEPPLRSCGSPGGAPALPSKPSAAGAMAPGEGLGPDAEVSSPDGRFRLIMQGDGNVVLYSGGVPLWDTATNGKAGQVFVMQTDGNLVLYSDTSCALWASNTDGHPGASLAVQNDGNVVIYDAGKALWASGTAGVLPAPTTTCGAVQAGHGLAAGESVTSCDGRFQLTLQGDGNAVLYASGMALWATGTDCQYGRSFAMQSDGNLVVYSNTGKALWSSGTYGHPGASLAVQNDGNVVIYDAGKALWASGTVVPGAPGAPAGCGAIKPGQGLEVGQSFKSCDSRFTLAMQSDGNLVLYEGSKALWATGTNGKAGFVANMQTDGNFVLYDTHGKALWSSGTYGHAGAYLAVQTDGNLVVYSGSTPLWDSGTYGH
jgi:hypothetical protein